MDRNVTASKPDRAPNIADHTGCDNATAPLGTDNAKPKSIFTCALEAIGHA
jgi:hypothetical protein